jgi:drug/metabolite transporter, DME family
VVLGLSDFHLSVVLALSAALVFSVGAHLTRFGLRTINAQSGAFISIASATALYWTAAPWQLQAAMFASTAFGWFVLAGLFRPAFSSMFAMIGTSILGPTISTTLSGTAPFFGLLAGVLILGETLSLMGVFGTFAIVAGIMLLARRGTNQATHWPMWALMLPVLAAVIRAGASVVTKIGLEDVPSPYFAGLVAYNASLMIAIANLVRRRVNIVSLATNPASLWFVLTGIAFGSAIFMVNAALQHGDVSVVMPLVSLEGVFVLVLGITVFREQTITWRISIAVLLVVLGAAAITARG